MGSQTVSLKFRTQMDGLSKLLESTQPHFVRCVKPNKKQEAHVFDGPMVMEQLNYLGVLETVRIRQMGYPVRKEYRAFVEEFWVLRSYLRGRGKAPQQVVPAATDGEGSSMYKQAGKRVAAEEHKKVAEAVVVAFIGAEGLIDSVGASVDQHSILHRSPAEGGSGGSGGSGSSGGGRQGGEGGAADGYNDSAPPLLIGQERAWQLGRTRLFLRDGVLPLLEKCVWKVRRYAATRLATVQRRRRCMIEYVNALRAALLVESTVRMFVGKRRVRRKREEAAAATRLQSCLARGRTARRAYEQKKRGACTMQALARGRKARLGTARRVRLLVPLQAIAKAFVGGLLYKRRRAAALTLHRVARGMLARKLARSMGNEYQLAQRIQTVVRGKLERGRYAHSLRAVVRLQAFARSLVAKAELRRAIKAVGALQLRARAMLIGNAARTVAVKWLLSDERAKQGQLTKRSILGRYGFNWKTRTFELSGLTLTYRKTKGTLSKFKSQLGVITINANDTVVQSSAIKPHCFMIRGVFQGLVQELFVVATSDEEREGWMKEIQTKIIAANFRSSGVSGGGAQITVLEIIRQRIRVIDPAHGAVKPVHKFPTLLNKRQSIMEKRKSMTGGGSPSATRKTRNSSDDSGDGDAPAGENLGRTQGAMAKTPSLDAIA
jgi:hypothetical protein